VDKVPRPGKKTKRLVLREIPFTTLQDRRLSDGDWRLLRFLATKQDFKTGELRIRGHFYSQEELIRMAQKAGLAGMSARSFKSFIYNLKRYGYLRELPPCRREHLDASGRKRIVYGPARYILSMTSQKPHEQRETDMPKSKSPHSQRVSPMCKKLHAQENARPPEKPSLQCANGQHVGGLHHNTPRNTLECAVVSPGSTPEGRQPFHISPSRTALQNRGGFMYPKISSGQNKAEPQEPLPPKLSSFDDAFPDFAKTPRYVKSFLFMVHANASGWDTVSRHDHGLARFLLAEFGSTNVAYFDEPTLRKAWERIAKGPAPTQAS
jgi:hypothetical protein